MEPDYFESFKQSQWLSIFVVHEIQLRPRCIMESVNGSLSHRLRDLTTSQSRLKPESKAQSL